MASTPCDRVGVFLMERPFVSFAVSALVILLMADSGRRVASEDSQSTVLVVVTISFMVLSAAYAVLLPRMLPSEAPREQVTAVRWVVCFSPFIAGFAAAMYGLSLSLMWLGVGITLLLLAGVAWGTTRVSGT